YTGDDEDPRTDQPLPQPAAAAPGRVQPAPLPLPGRAARDQADRADRLARRMVVARDRGRHYPRSPHRERRHPGRASALLVHAGWAAWMVWPLLPRVGAPQLRPART